MNNREDSLDEYDPEIQTRNYERIHSVKPCPKGQRDLLDQERCPDCGGLPVKAKVTLRTIIACNNCEKTLEVLFAR